MVMLVEKLRAFSGQRKFSIARDIYDIYFLLEKKADIQKAINAFSKKCAVKNISLNEIEFDKVIYRKEEYELNWKDNLEYLVPESLKISFDEAWDLAIKLLKQTLKPELFFQPDYSL